jgi:hypothetical protein
MIYTPDEVPDQVDSPEWDPRDERAIARRLRSEKGRVLQAVGWHNFKPNASVGALAFHVEARRPLLVTGLAVIDGLPGYDEQEIRTALLAGALAVAEAMKEKGDRKRLRGLGGTR